MDVLFCTCNNPGCAKHPGNHGEGCTACVRSHLKGRTLPRCFFVKLAGDIEGMADWSYEAFARLVAERAGPLTGATVSGKNSSS